MSKFLTAFLADERGATAIEYSLIAGGVALAIVTAVVGLGTKVNAMYGNVSSSMK